MRGRRPHRILDPDRLVMDFLPAEDRKVGSHGFQMNRCHDAPISYIAVYPPSATICAPVI
jgi:hypothetical protein